MSATHAYSISELALTQASAAGTQVDESVFRVLARAGRWFARPIVGYVEDRARRVATGAVWFQGALASLPEEPESVYQEDALIPLLETAESQLISLRQTSLKIVADLESMDGRRDGELRSAFRKMAIACVDLFDAIQAFRWALLERNADADMAAGRVESFQTAEQLIASLKNR